MYLLLHFPLVEDFIFLFCSSVSEPSMLLKEMTFFEHSVSILPIGTKFSLIYFSTSLASSSDDFISVRQARCKSVEYLSFGLPFTISPCVPLFFLRKILSFHFGLWASYRVLENCKDRLGEGMALLTIVLEEWSIPSSTWSLISLISNCRLASH